MTLDIVQGFKGGFSLNAMPNVGLITSQFNHLPIGIVHIDAEDRIAWANAVCLAWCHCHETDLANRTIRSLLPQFGQSNAANDGHLADSRCYLQTPFGELKPVRWSMVPVDFGGSVFRMISIEDESRYLLQSKQLEQIQNRLNEFTCVASHDFRAPLRGITDLLHWMAEDLGEAASPDVVNHLQRAHVRVDRMQRMLDDLLAYVRLDTAEVDCEMISPRDLIEDILDLQAIPERFDVQVQATSDPVNLHRAPLEMVLRNLIGNAVRHHHGRAGKIAIRADLSGTYCQFRIEDDGPGIPLKSRNRVFGLFQTISDRGAAGAGMGLAISKCLVEKHGGRISIDDGINGSGAGFNVMWPKARSVGPDVGGVQR